MPSQVPRQIKTTIGLNLKAARQNKRLTQRELAQLLDTDAFQVSRWERGQIRPADERLVQMAEVLGVDYGWFFNSLEEAA